MHYRPFLIFWKVGVSEKIRWNYQFLLKYRTLAENLNREFSKKTFEKRMVLVSPTYLQQRDTSGVEDFR